MADEKEETPEEPIVAGSKKKLIMLASIVVAVLAGGGSGAWFFLGSSSGEEVQEVENTSDHKDTEHNEPGPVMDVDSFLVNLADQQQLRYLKMSIKLELDRPEAETDFQEKLPAIRDVLLVLLTSKESQTLRTVNGKHRVREEILTRTNGVMSKGKVTKVYFTDFVIQ